MLAKETLSFLKNLSKNNNREWLQADKPAFENAKNDFATFVSELIARISQFDPQVQGLLPDSCTFRIYRDVRFSKDKAPYKSNFGAYISPGGRKSAVPGYYLHLQPGQSFIAAGKYQPESAALLSIRNAVANNTDEFVKILKAKGFQKCYGEIHGEKLKTVPKGFPKEHKAAEYLKLKTFMAYLELHDDKFLTSAQCPAFVVSAFKEAKPLVDFLRNSLAAQ